jgi:hypothetical protein
MEIQKLIIIIIIIIKKKKFGSGDPSSPLLFSLDAVREAAIAAMSSKGLVTDEFLVFSRSAEGTTIITSLLLYMCSFLKLRKVLALERRLAANNEEARAGTEEEKAEYRAEMAHWLRAHAAQYIHVLLQQRMVVRGTIKDDLPWFEAYNRLVGIIVEMVFREEVHGEVDVELGRIFRTRKYNREAHRLEQGGKKFLGLKELYHIRHDDIPSHRKHSRFFHRRETEAGAVFERSPVISALLPSPRAKAAAVTASPKPAQHYNFVTPYSLADYMAQVPYSVFNPEEGPVPVAGSFPAISLPGGASSSSATAAAAAATAAQAQTPSTRPLSRTSKMSVASARPKAEDHSPRRGVIQHEEADDFGVSRRIEFDDKLPAIAAQTPRRTPKKK